MRVIAEACLRSNDVRVSLAAKPILITSPKVPSTSSVSVSVRACVCLSVCALAHVLMCAGTHVLM